MRKGTIVLAAVTVLAVFALGPPLASADQTTFTLNVYNLSGYAGPYATVLVNLTSHTSATITFSADPGFLLFDSSAAAVNVNGTFSLGGLTGTKLSGFSGPQLTNAGFKNAVDGWGSFN